MKTTQYQYPYAQDQHPGAKSSHFSVTKTAIEANHVSFSRHIEKSFEERLTVSHVPPAKFCGLLFTCLSILSLILFSGVKPCSLSYNDLIAGKKSCVKLCILRI
ncbi:hypothetical protein MUY27_04930 [Mucilaginibacter sp. RS28]|uniref:Uncharacterized protein n=1 Tax=Mucilaginibacter straminoryzae TaxID=2932774 RepID=A0A9X2BAQ4_9SPHI|nr:hypothetical protein [Mucilaginibacter straminoryzae]MCJ8209042.1 hypothetical protein [Mucilaginibacter straminoryzae]